MGIQSGEGRGQGVSRPEWRALWPAPSTLMSATEGAEAPAEGVDDAENEDEPTIPLAAVSAATTKRHVALLLKRLIQHASDSELSPGKSIVGTNAIRSQEKVDTAAAGSLVGLVHEILLGQRWHLSGRQIWDIVRAAIPKTEAEHWKSGAQSFLINVTVEKRQFAVKDILTELVEKEGMAAALTDFGTSDDERLACTRRVCKILDGFHTSTVVIATAPRRKATAGGSAGGSSSTNPPPPTPRTPAKVRLKSSVEELAAYQPGQVHSAAELLGKNSSPIMQSQNFSPASRKRFRDTLDQVAAALVLEIPQEIPEGVLGPNALALLQYIASTGAKTMKADVTRVKLQQRSLFPGGESEAAADAERQEEEDAVPAGG